MAPDQRSSALTLALERGYQTQRQNEFKDFARTLEQPSGLSQPNLTTHFLSYATSPETMLAAFSRSVDRPQQPARHSFSKATPWCTGVHP